MATATTWGAAAQSGKAQSATKDKSTEESKVIEVSGSDYDVSNDDDGDVVTLVIMGQEYALDLETAGNLAEDLVDANPNLEKTEQD